MHSQNVSPFICLEVGKTCPPEWCNFLKIARKGVKNKRQTLTCANVNAK